MVLRSSERESIKQSYEGRVINEHFSALDAGDLPCRGPEQHRDRFFGRHKQVQLLLAISTVTLRELSNSAIASRAFRPVAIAFRCASQLERHWCGRHCALLLCYTYRCSGVFNLAPQFA